MSPTDKLKRLRTEKGMTQQKLSDAVGIDISLLQRYERFGFERAGARTVLRLAQALDTTVEELMGGGDI